MKHTLIVKHLLIYAHPESLNALIRGHYPISITISQPVIHYIYLIKKEITLHEKITS